MLVMLTGAVILIATGIVFRFCLPRDGKMHRLVGTAWEAYVGVAFCAAIALGFTMLVSGAIDLVGTP
jgi:hypothetical protein